MSNATTVLSWDTYTQASRPGGNSSTANTILVSSAAAALGWLYWGQVYRGRDVTSAKLQLYLQAATTTSTTLTVGGSDAQWTMDTLTWTNQPGQAASPAAATVVIPSGRPAGSVVEVDVTTLVQAHAAGGSNFGARMSSTAQLIFWSANNPYSQYRPRLVVEWGDPPDTPTRLAPNGGRAVSSTRPVLACNFTDDSGHTACNAIQVRTFTSEAGATANTTPEFDSGWVLSSIPQIDLSTTSFTALADGAQRWWRVRVRDDGGGESGWSPVATFTYRALPTVTLTNPPGAQIFDSTPNIAWTVSGGSQASRVVQIQDATTGAVLFSTGRQTTSVTNYTIPDERVLRSTSKTYRLTVSVWDTYNRETIMGARAYGFAQVDMTYSYDATVTPPASVTVTTGADGEPVAQVWWTRSTFPDYFAIRRNGIVLANRLAPASTLVSGTTHQYVDWGVPPRTDLTYEVTALVNGKWSNYVAAPVYFSATKDAWLMDPTGEIGPVVFKNVDLSWALGEDSARSIPLGSDSSVLRTQGMRGFEGSVKGDLFTDGQQSASSWRDRFSWYRARPGRVWNLVLVDYSLEVTIDSAKITPFSVGTEPAYAVEFNFAEESGPVHRAYL